MSGPNVKNALQATTASAQKAQGMTVHSLLASLTTSILINTPLHNSNRGIYLSSQPLSSLKDSSPDSRRGSLRSLKATLVAALTSSRRSEEDYLFTRFLVLICRLFFPFVITALPILITLNLKYAGKSGIQGLDRLGWSGIDPGHTRIFWLHSALQVTFNVYFCSLIGAEVCAILSYQQKLIKASVQTSSVLIRGIPKEDMSEEILSQMYDKVSRGVRRVWLFRDDAKIREMIQRRKKLLDRLEVAQTAFIIRAVKARASLASQSAHNTGTKQHSTTHRTGPLSLSPSKEYRDVMRQPVPHSGWRPILMCSRPKVDVIDYCRAEIAMLNQDIENATSKLWQVAPQNAAIIEFNHRIDAHVVSQARAHESPFQFCTEILDISGTRFNVDSFNMKWWQRYMRFASVTAASLTLLIGWALPVALTGFVSQIAYLEGLYPSLARVPKWILVFLQGALPQCTLILLTMGLPSVVQLLISQLRLSQASHVGKWTQRLYFSFLFIHVFLTVAVSSSVTTVIDRLYHGVNNVPELLASNLPKSSNYFLSYLLIQALSISAAQVLQPVRLVQYYILSPLCDASPRQKYERQTAASTQEWAIIYPVYTNLACIGMIYLFIAPLMAAFTLFAFILFFLSFRFSTPRVYYNDYGGLLYLSALNHLFVGAYVQQITLIGLYLSVRDTKHQYACIGQTVITVISLGLTFSFQLHLRDRAKNMASHMPVVEKRDRIHQSECSFLYRWFSLDCTPFTRAASLPPPSFNANALNIQPPIIWIPRDRLGLSHAKVAQALTNHYQPRFSDANACVDTSGHLHIGGPSPEQMLASSDDPEATTPSLHMSIATKSG